MMPLTTSPAPSRRRRLRRLLIWGTSTFVLLIVAVIGVGALLWSRAATNTVGDLAFANPLHIPALVEPTVADDGTNVFDLSLQAGSSEIRRGITTDTWGINGDHLGPTLRASRGDDIRINMSNQLPETTTLHWHGMHLPAAADGGPHQQVVPGATWSPAWTVDQPAATLWYHPHLHGRTADHVYRGLAGMFIVDDPDTTDSLDLPSEYGVDDIPIIVQDKRFDGDGNFDHGAPMFSPIGVLGNHLLVNGTYDPHLDVTTTSVRLRLLNASNARVYSFGFDDDRYFHQIATDGGLLNEPHRTRRVQLSPGERAEIVVNVEAGERAVLQSFAPELGLDFFQGRFAGGDDRFDVLEVRASSSLSDGSELPSTLAGDESLATADADVTRRFELNGSSRINGQRIDIGRIDEVAEVDTIERWEVTNGSGNMHNFHIHDVQFRIVEYDGRPPPPELQGPKDTVFLPPGVTAHLVMRFGDYTDPDRPYMYHCHVLRHEDDGMMGQFTVVAPGTVDDAPTTVEVPPDHQH